LHIFLNKQRQKEQLYENDSSDHRPGDATGRRQQPGGGCGERQGAGGYPLPAMPRSELYTRPNRRVTSLPGLHKQIRFCEQNLGLTWFDDDIENTATYLNQEFYKFK
jgi:hypothetical protein